MCSTEGACVVLGPAFDESIFIFHKINTHVPLSALITHVGKLQNRQLHFEFTSGRSVFIEKCKKKKLNKNINTNDAYSTKYIFTFSVLSELCFFFFNQVFPQRATLKVMSHHEN